MPLPATLRGLSSSELFERARAVLAGGVSHENRYASPHPKYIRRAQGSRKWEVDDTEYIDYSMGSASLLLGHAHPAVVTALIEQAPLGTYFADCHPLEVRWGEQVQALVPCAERVRFTASGSEATLLAMRLGRAFSGRPKVLRFEGHYHGWHDYAALGSKAPWDQLPSLGMLPGAAEATVVVPPDADRTEAALAADPGIGTIVCETSGANYGCVPLPDGFLPALRALADRFGVVLIFDEVITGFRWSPGGRQARDGVTPDLTTLAKVLTGGLPGGAVAGRAEVMALLDPRQAGTRGLSPAVMHKGTFNGSPMVAAPAVAALDIIATGEPQARADAVATRLRAGMQEIFDHHQVAGTVYGESSTFHVHFGHRSLAGLDAASIRGVPKPVVDGFRDGLRRRGVDLMSFTSGVTSAAHTDDDVEATLAAFADTLEEMLAAGHLGRE